MEAASKPREMLGDANMTAASQPTKARPPELAKVNGEWRFGGCRLAGIQAGTRLYDQWKAAFPNAPEPWLVPPTWTP